MARVCLFFWTPLILVDSLRNHSFGLGFDKTLQSVETLWDPDRSTRSVPTRPDPRRFCFFWRNSLNAKSGP